MFAQKLLPALAVISVAAAQCTQSTATINNQAEATALASCSTFRGSILIAPGVAGTINIDGPQQVTGDVICADAGLLNQLSSSTIGVIGGTFGLNNLTLLSTLGMTALTSVGTIAWTALPALNSLTFPSVVTKAKSVTISNTFLQTLEGINLDTVQTLEINNNNRLRTFSTQVSNITSSLNIAANGDRLDVSFPNLIWAANMTFRKVASVSIPSLAVVNGSLGFYESNIQSIAAPNLTSVGSFATGQGSLAFVDDQLLTNISMPLLKTVGGAVQIANNTNLHAISFPALANVGGAIDFSGNFTTPELPGLANVKGGFNLQSKQNIACDGFKSNSGPGKTIQGTFTCRVGDVVGGIGSTPTGSGSKPTGAASTFDISSFAAGLSVVGGLLQML